MFPRRSRTRRCFTRPKTRCWTRPWRTSWTRSWRWRSSSGSLAERTTRRDLRAVLHGPAAVRVDRRPGPSLPRVHRAGRDDPRRRARLQGRGDQRRHHYPARSRRHDDRDRRLGAPGRRDRDGGSLARLARPRLRRAGLQADPLRGRLVDRRRGWRRHVRAVRQDDVHDESAHVRGLLGRSERQDATRARGPPPCRLRHGALALWLPKRPSQGPRRSLYRKRDRDRRRGRESRALDLRVVRRRLVARTHRATAERGCCSAAPGPRQADSPGMALQRVARDGPQREVRGRVDLQQAPLGEASDDREAAPERSLA